MPASSIMRCLQNMEFATIGYSIVNDRTENVANAVAGAKVVVSVLEKVKGAVTKTGSSAETMLTASQAVEAAAADLREKVEGFLHKVAV